jgi:hypothetical protein
MPRAAPVPCKAYTRTNTFNSSGSTYSGIAPSSNSSQLLLSEGRTPLLLPSKCLSSHPISISGDDDEDDISAEVPVSRRSNIVVLSSTKEEEESSKTASFNSTNTNTATTNTTSSNTAVEVKSSSKRRWGFGKARTAAAAVVGVAAQLVCWGAW